MNLEQITRRILKEESEKKQKVFYGFQGIPNFWTDDYDNIKRDKYFEDKDYQEYYFDNFYDMDKEFGHERSLFGTRGLPVGHPKRSSKSFDMYNKEYGPAIVRVITDINLQENVKKMLNEDTKGINNFLDTITNVHEMSDELKGFVKKFIEESECKRINFSNFKIPVMGLALESGVLINSTALRQQLPFLLFLIFHEVAHQYQFKKYGADIMYNCYIGDISERDAAEFMKKTEEVADEFASRKIRQLQKLDLIGPYTPPQMYKNVPIQQIMAMMNNYKNDMSRKNIDSPSKVSEYFYNMVKSEL